MGDDLLLRDTSKRQGIEYRQMLISLVTLQNARYSVLYIAGAAPVPYSEIRSGRILYTYLYGETKSSCAHIRFLNVTDLKVVSSCPITKRGQV